MSKLDGKIALVSGSGRGIGREIALKLASEGARIVVNDLDAKFAEETVAVIREAGSDAVACVGNVTDADFGDRFVKSAIDTFGGIDIIVNNAGYTWDNVIQKTTDEQWYAMMDVHMTAPFRILRAAADFIRHSAKREAEEGREVFRKVVNVSSLVGVGGNAGQIGYGAAKAGVTGITRDGQGMGALQGQCQLRRIRPDTYTLDRSASRQRRDQCRGTRGKGRRQSRRVENDGSRYPAWPWRHTRGSRGRGLHVLYPRIQLRQRPGCRVQRRFHVLNAQCSDAGHNVAQKRAKAI